MLCWMKCYQKTRISIHNSNNNNNNIIIIIIIIIIISYNYEIIIINYYLQIKHITEKTINLCGKQYYRYTIYAIHNKLIISPVKLLF